MKHRKSLSILMILGALLWPASFAPTAQGQPGGRRAVISSGLVKTGPGQLLRLTVNLGSGNDQLTVVFRKMYYTTTVGPDIHGVTKMHLMAQDTSDPITLNKDEAASMVAGQEGFDGVRIEALIRGFSGATRVDDGVLQIINPDGTVAAFFKISPEVT